jgi:hypothetical protein
MMLDYLLGALPEVDIDFAFQKPVYGPWNIGKSLLVGSARKVLVKV